MTVRNIRLVEFKDEEVYPIEKSADCTNAFYCDFCSSAGYRPNYASCLRRIADRKEGRLNTNEAACSAAIGNRTCAALAMKKEEKQAGHSLYYINRVKMRQNQVDNAELIGIKLGKRLSRGLIDPKPRFVAPQDADLNKNIPQGIEHTPEFKTAPTIADAINKKIRELAKEESIEKSSAVNASPSKVESVESKTLVSGDLSKPTAPIKTEGLSLLEIARLRKQQTINA